jgi:hypothetical protein
MDIREMTIRVDQELSDSVVLWRYMSFDKFIHLIDSRSLFLAPISFFKNSDPLEGHLPRKFHEEIESNFQEMRNESKKSLEIFPIEEQVILKEYNEMSEQRMSAMTEKMRERQCICCWFESKLESEAMWKLYGDNGKAIAIKTTVGSLREAIQSVENKNTVFLNRVKYIDFNDKELKIEDFPHKEKASILLKRKEYEHEKEVRLYHRPDEQGIIYAHSHIFTDYWIKYSIKSYSVNVDINKLIENIVVSPYVSEPFLSSVRAICDKYKLNNSVVYQSTLLENYGVR